MKASRVLVVDDNAANLKLMAYVLKSKGYDVVAASDASEAFASIAQAHPALILLDLQLPGIDGLDVCRTLKGDPVTAAIPVVAVTASAMKGDEARARAAGFDGYVTKPIDTRALPLLVAAFMHPSRPPTPT